MPPRQKIKYKVFEHCRLDPPDVSDQLVHTFTNEVRARECVEKLNREKGENLVYYMQIHYLKQGIEE